MCVLTLNFYLKIFRHDNEQPWSKNSRQQAKQTDRGIKKPFTRKGQIVFRGVKFVNRVTDYRISRHQR